MTNFAIVRSVDAPKHISPEELHAYTDHVTSGMGLIAKLLPPILVMHVSESVAAVVGVASTGVIRHNRSTSSDLSSYYELWLVGQAGMADYALALEGILDDFYAFSNLSNPAATKAA